MNFKKLLFECPIEPNSAISARAVFPQSGHIRLEKRPISPDFSKENKNVLSTYRGPIYQLKAHEMLFRVQKK